MRRNYKDLLNRTSEEVEAIANDPSHPLCQQIREQKKDFFQEMQDQIIPSFPCPKDFPAMAAQAKKIAGGFNPPVDFEESLALHMPKVAKIYADMKEADRVADELIRFINNAHVPLQDISTLPPVSVLAVLSIMAKGNHESYKKANAILEKSLAKARGVQIKNRKIKSTEKYRILKKAIQDYIAYRIKNGINDFPRLKEIYGHLSNQFLKRNEDDKDRYTESSLLRKIEEIVPALKASIRETNSRKTS